MILPTPGEDYDQANEAAARRSVEQELARVNAQLQSIRDALKAAVALPIIVRS